MRLEQTTTTVYNVPYKNLLIELKFSDTRLFWVKYSKAIDVTLTEIIGDLKSLSDVAKVLANELGMLGAVSVKVLDKTTAHGVEIAIAPVESRVKNINLRKREITE